jgi:phosphatidylethanolamine-binding protein (PEBP) family uncharacterized protein
VIVSDEYGASSTISIIVESQNSLSYTSLDLHLPEHIISKEAESVKLNASSTSYYLDGYTGDIGDISYQWYQLQGTPVSLSNSTNDIASFTTPSYSTYSENLIFLVALSSDNLISYKKVEVEVMESSTEDFTLSSSDFSNFGDIPTNISSPQFNLDNVSNEAQEILIVTKDESYDYIYGAMWDIPASTLSIEQDSTDYSLMASSNLSNYDNGEKTYSFTAYTLDTDLTLTNADFSDEDSLETALGSNVISKSTLYGHLSQ